MRFFCFVFVFVLFCFCFIFPAHKVRRARELRVVHFLMIFIIRLGAVVNRAILSQSTVIAVLAAVAALVC